MWQNVLSDIVGSFSRTFFNRDTLKMLVFKCDHLIHVNNHQVATTTLTAVIFIPLNIHVLGILNMANF